MSRTTRCVTVLVLAAATAGCALPTPGTKAACDALAYSIANAPGPEALAAATVEKWAEMARHYRGSLGDTGDALVRDSADVLDRATTAPYSTRILALDTAAARCRDTGWTAD
jgi:hypothetical protein